MYSVQLSGLKGRQAVPDNFGRIHLMALQYDKLNA